MMILPVVILVDAVISMIHCHITGFSAYQLRGWQSRFISEGHDHTKWQSVATHNLGVNWPLSRVKTLITWWRNWPGISRRALRRERVGLLRLVIFHLDFRPRPGQAKVISKLADKSEVHVSNNIQFLTTKERTSSRFITWAPTAEEYTVSIATIANERYCDEEHCAANRARLAFQKEASQIKHNKHCVVM